MNTLKHRQHLRHAYLTLGLLMSVSAVHAGIGDTPFSLTLGQSILRDSNVERTDAGRSDTVTSTSVVVGFDKEYGRQSYSATLQGMMQRYQDLSDYNNNAISADLNVSTEIGLRTKVDIQHKHDRSIQDFEQQGLDTRTRKTVVSNQTYINAYHGLHGKWKLVGNVGFTKVDFDTSPAENRDSRTLRVGVRHEPTDLLYIEAGVRRTQTDYPELTVFTGPTTSYVGDRVQRSDLDFQTGWTISDNSKLTGQINLTREKHESLATGAPGDSARDYSGVTGSVNWIYTPRGKLSYVVKLSRDTNNSGGYSSKVNTTTQEKLNTSLDLNALWNVTYKVALRAGLGFQRIQEDEQQRFSGGPPLTENASGTRRSATLSAEYELSRSWFFSCAVAKLDRTRTIFNSGYVSNSMSCSGNFLMN